MTPSSPSVTRFDHVDDTLGAALGPDLAALWRRHDARDQLSRFQLPYVGA
jgi:hypothetical protein